MSLNTKILKLFGHRINMDMLWIKNTESPNQNIDLGEDVINNISEVVGDLYPMVDINGYVFTHNDISYMELCENGFVPNIKIQVTDESGEFTNKYYPKNKCLLKLYIKSKNKNIKAIRNDYIIDIKPSQINSGKSAEGRGHSYFITGSLNIPRITNKEINSFNSHSYDAMIDVAKLNDLGFASNEIDTNDKMVWLQSSSTFIEFIQFMTNHAYKDSESFFISFIDRYYNLNFINVHNMMSIDPELDIMYLNLTSNVNTYLKGSDPDIDDPKNANDNQLSNYTGNRGNNTYITSYTIDSKQGKILRTNPDKKIIHYYDIIISNVHRDKFINLDVSSSGILKSDEDINNNISNIWESIDIGNTHDNFYYAKHFNIQSQLDLKKNRLVVILEGANLNLLRGMRIPVVIVKEGEYSKFNEPDFSDDDDSSDDIRVDKDLTGFYIIDTIKFIYDPYESNLRSPYSTEVILQKQFWGKNLEIQNA